MAGLCEGGNEPPGSLKVRLEPVPARSRSGMLTVNPQRWTYVVKPWFSEPTHARCEARIAQIRTTREIASGSYGCEVRRSLISQ
ncbi:hypothetical protein ANN_22308 [Periplaneta americana]|uniref:Uncharacterized protein n=1 Tax=Periplaneta americana TaxID=6978 RepID=A0ABQ8S8A4_PERAM|nr:hypothetical protein ANN_22308 [Periplaneta americana]